MTDSEYTVRAPIERAFESIGRPVVPAYEASYVATALGLVKAGLYAWADLGVQLRRHMRRKDTFKRFRWVAGMARFPLVCWRMSTRARSVG